MMIGKGFLLESYKGTVGVVLQPKEPLRESSQASTFSAKIMWRVERFVFKQPAKEHNSLWCPGMSSV